MSKIIKVLFFALLRLPLSNASHIPNNYSCVVDLPRSEDSEFPKYKLDLYSNFYYPHLVKNLSIYYNLTITIDGNFSIYGVDYFYEASLNCVEEGNENGVRVNVSSYTSSIKTDTDKDEIGNLGSL